MGWHFTTDVFREPTGMSTSEPHPDQSSANFTSFDADGFTVGSPGTFGGLNTNGVAAVAWCWKANGSGSSNTDGSINTIATSANVAGGFSISSYTGTGSNGTIGHGLSVAPNLVIVKRRDVSNTWIVGSVQPLASMDFTDNLVLNTADALSTTAAARWNSTAPTADVFSIGTNTECNASGSTYAAYCWHSVEGYSKIGSYVGNSDAEGSFVYCGFRPAWVLVKAINGGHSWFVVNNKSAPYNVMSNAFLADRGDAYKTGTHVDFLSDGFKWRGGADAWFNGAFNYIFMAIAETPFKYSNAR